MRLWYENKRGEMIDLINDRDFAMLGVTGLASLPQNNLSTIETVFPEGDTVNNRRRSSRQIIFTHQFLKNTTEARRTFARILDQGEKGNLRFQDDAFDVFLPVEVETCEILNTEFPVKATTTFVGNYPYFRDVEAESVVNKAFTGGWSFPYRYPVNFGHSTIGDSMQIANDGDFEKGFVCKIHFAGAVSYPFIQNQNNEMIMIDTTFSAGEGLRISTLAGDKYLMKIEQIEGEEFETSVLQYLTNDSTMFNLYRGINFITVSALNGAENIEAEIIFENAYKVI